LRREARASLLLARLLPPRLALSPARGRLAAAASPRARLAAASPRARLAAASPPELRLSLNPPLLASGVPLGLADEWFLLEREELEVALETRVAGLGRQTLKRARLFLTTKRLVAVAPAATAAGLRALELPLAGLSAEAFVQPLFGCNYLEALVAPARGGGLEAAAAPPRARVYFLRGGAGTFLRVFFATMGRLRAGGDAEARAAALAPPAAARWLGEMVAFADPADPSRLFLAQPEAGAAAGGGAAGAAAAPPPAGYARAAP